MISYLLSTGDKMAIQAIHEKFDETEWNELQDIKKRAGLTWHDFILQSARRFDYGDDGK